MKTMLKTTAAALALTVGATAAAAEEKVVLYHWFEYMPQELLDKFTAETGIKVTMDTFDSNEAMLASLKAGAIGTYDLSVPGDYMVAILKNQGMLDTIADGELKNKANISDQWLDVDFDPGRMHSIPYQWGSTSFSVNRDDYQGDIQSTDILFNPPEELKGRINVLDSQADVLAMASLHLGIPQCTNDREQLKALNALVQGAKENWTSFNSDTAKEVLVSGDVSAGMIWNGFSAKARAEGANVEYAYPEQGMLVWMDNIVLLKDAPNRENALKFLDFMLEPENVAALTNWTQYSAGVDGVSDHLDEALRTSPENNPPAGVSTAFIQVCDEQTQAVYDTIWTNLKK
ncbi:ABC transporter substrate-binding protein [Leisingera sp. ANG-M1]|uniref:extracellular solute-binding protein n=1 Tax=Leisingera sp. ANG-M1 TaxID=1577895 RepID=UPI00057FB79E|nr:extracellular solute-binding protein [Leisingera sp. ANG-M1]KIC09230.1 ABC transporter substrate-binding protein [Leisingera sp. ANG-M1]